jgi:hypothetical protein
VDPDFCRIPSDVVPGCVTLGHVAGKPRPQNVEAVLKLSHVLPGPVHDFSLIDRLLMFFLTASGA